MYGWIYCFIYFLAYFYAFVVPQKKNRNPFRITLLSVCPLLRPTTRGVIPPEMTNTYVNPKLMSNIQVCNLLEQRRSQTSTSRRLDQKLQLFMFRYATYFDPREVIKTYRILPFGVDLITWIKL